MRSGRVHWLPYVWHMADDLLDRLEDWNDGRKVLAEAIGEIRKLRERIEQLEELNRFRVHHELYRGLRQENDA